MPLLFWNVFVQVLLPILVLIAVGWLIDRRQRLDLGSLVRLNLYLFVPAFIFYEVVRSDFSGAEALKIMEFTLSVVALMFLASALLGRAKGYAPDETRSLQLATMFYNSGNFGVPLMALAFPGAGPILQVFVVLTQNLCTFTVGLALASSAQRKGWRAALPMLRQVSLWAVGAALLARATHAPVPQWRWVWTPVSYLHDGLVAVALVTLGIQLSQTSEQVRSPRLPWAIGLRLLGGPIAACALVPLFGFTGETARIMVLSSGFPTAVNTALIAHEFKADSHFAASVVFYSTLFSTVTVTTLIVTLRLC